MAAASAMPSPSPPATSSPTGFHYLVILDLESTCDDAADPNRQEIVEWPWVVYDTALRSVVDYKQIFIAPAWNNNPNPPSYSYSEEDVLFAASLKEAVQHFDTYLLHSFVRHHKSFCLLTDGPWDVQHFLLLEAARKAIPLAPHYRCFFNLRAEFTLRYPQFGAPRDRYGMMNSLGISRNSAQNGHSANINGNANVNNMCNTGIDDCIAISDIVSRMIYDNHVFRSPFIIPEYDWSTALMQRIPSVAIPVAAAVPIGCIIRLRGLPWSCTELDIARFLVPIKIVPAGIHFVRNSHGKSTGEAFVQLENESAIKAALARHRNMMGRRYIEVFKSSPNDMTNHLGRADARRIMHQQHQAHAHVHKAAAAAAAAVSGYQAGGRSGNSNNNNSRDNRTGGGGRNNNIKGTPRSVHIDAHTSPELQSSSATSTPIKGNNTAAAYPQSPMMRAQTSTNAAYTSSTLSGLAYVVRVSGLPDDIREDDLLPIFDGIEMVGDGIHLVPLQLSAGIVGEETSPSSTGNGNNNNTASTPKRPRRRRGRREAFVLLTGESWVRKACLRTGSVECPRGSGNICHITVARSTPGEMRATMASMPGTPGTPGKDTDIGKSESAERSYLMQVRNLEATTTIDSIAKLFSGLGVNPGDVMISGEKVAQVSFLSREARDIAVKTTALPGVWEAAGEGRLDNGNNGIDERGRVVRMRGLPYSATDSDILAFFEMGNITARTEDISRGKDRQGRASGEAWVTLKNAKEAQLAVLKLDKEHMGSRYIELLVCGNR